MAIPQDLGTPIGKKWSELQLDGIFLGDPTGVEQPVPGGAPATYQPYANHVIVHSNDFGAVYMPMSFFNKWISLPVYAQFGVPTTDYGPFGTLYHYVEFGGGWMIDDGAGGARVVYGAIYDKFRVYARELGAPLTDEANTPNVPGARFQVFAGGEVHWGKVEENDPATTSDDRWAAAAVFEPIVGHWHMTGGPSGWLGLPVGDSASLIASDDEVIGSSCRFQNGTMYENFATGATSVLPGQALPKAYERHGGPRGWLGWPISGAGTTASGKRFVDFATGVLVERPTPTGIVGEAFGDLKFHLGTVSGSDPCPNPFDPDPDLKFYVTVDSSQGLMHPTEPFGEFESHPVVINADMGTSRVANSALTITATVHIFDIDDGACGGNEDLGRATFTYDIDNLWGLGLNDRHDTPGGGGWATFNIKSTHAFDENDFRGQRYWSFRNFSTERLDTTLYAETFSDVDEGFDLDDPGELDPFKLFFYYAFFEGAANGGNCTGMNLESIFAGRGRSIIGMPIHSNGYSNTQDGFPLNPFEPAAPAYDPAHAPLYKDINVRQASQAGADVILWKANEFLAGRMWAPGAVFNFARTFEDLGDSPIIGMTKAQFGGAAHSLRPYWFDSIPSSTSCRNNFFGAGCSRIFVADPNQPTGPNNPPAQDARRSRADDTYIEISPDGWQFDYTRVDPATGLRDTYSGAAAAGGMMWFEPAHLYASKQVTPFSAAWLARHQAYMFIVKSSGKTDQIADTQGRTMFEPVQGYPTLWTDIRRDPATRIPNLAPVIQTDALADHAQSWIGFGAGETHDYDIIPTAGVAAQTPVEVVFQSAGLSSLFSLPAIPGKADRVSALDINGSSKAISLALPADGTAKAVTWTISGGVKKRWMELSALGMSPAQNIRIRVENGGKRLVINNSGPPTSATLRYNDPDQDGGPVNLGTVNIAGAPNVTVIDPSAAQAPFTPQTLAPIAWYRATASTVVQSGAAVTQWLDSSGNGHHLAQVNPAARPSYSANAWNGSSPALTFDGVDDFLEYATPAGRLLGDLAGEDKPFSVLMTWEALDLDGDYDLVQWDNGGENGGNSLIELRTNQTGPDEAKYRHRRGDGITSFQNTGNVKFTLGRRVTAFVFDGTRLSIYDGDTTHLTDSPNDRESLTLVRFRLAGGDNQPLNGRVAELVVTPYALSSSTVQQYRTYAQQTWGGL